MRAVGTAELHAFLAALREIERVAQRDLAATIAGVEQAQALADQGKAGEAEEQGASALVAWQLKVAAIGARYEEAVVGLLGERRRADESTEAYVVRTMTAAQDLQSMLAMQHRNGLVYVG